jgi:hypothetical protein
MVIAMILPPFLLIACALYVDGGIGGYLANVGVMVVLVFSFLLILGVWYYRQNYLSHDVDIGYHRIFLVEDAGVVADEVERNIHIAFHPLKVESDQLIKAKFVEPKGEVETKIFTNERDGVKGVVILTVDHDKGSVTVNVRTSNRQHRYTRDLLASVTETMEDLERPWPTVNVKAEWKRLLKLINMGAEERDWTETKSRSSLNLGIAVVIGSLVTMSFISVAPFIWEFDAETVAFTAMFIIFVQLMAALPALAIEMWVFRRQENIAMEYQTTFPASPWYVTGAIEERLQRLGRDYRSERRIDPTNYVPSERLEILGVRDARVFIDVSLSDPEKKIDTSVVFIRTSRLLNNIWKTQKFVEKAVFHRKNR